MRALYHHRTLADGAEGIHIEEMVAAFRALGHEVYVAGLAADDTAHRRSAIEGIRERLPRAVFEAASVATNALEYLQMRKAIRRFRPDFMYKRHACHDVGALYAARDAAVPAVLEVNCLFTDDEYSRFEPKALETAAAFLERRALRAATLRLAVSTPLARQIRRFAGLDAIVMPNGADPDRFDSARVKPAEVITPNRLGPAVVVGWTGVVRKWHGLELLLNAVASIPGSVLLIVGDGPARPDVEACAMALGIADRLVVTGRVPHQQIPSYIAAMDIAVVAHDRTGIASPMKLLEYMAMARAVVAPRLENIRDVVIDGDNGMLFEPGDAAALATVLRCLAADRSLRLRLGAAARRTVEVSRNWRRNAQDVVAMVGSLGRPTVAVTVGSQNGALP